MQIIFLGEDNRGKTWRKGNQMGGRKKKTEEKSSRKLKKNVKKGLKTDKYENPMERFVQS